MNLQINRRRTFFNTIIIVLITFLLIYHISKLYNIYFGNDFLSSKEFLNSFKNDFPISISLIIQSIFRALIITSLIYILLKKKFGIIGMWLGVVGLIIIQFIIVNQSNSETIQSIHSGVKPLKGLILPIIITSLFFKKNQK